MEVCQVTGSITATAKDEKLVGHKLLVVVPLLPAGTESPPFVAVDTVGAGIGEKVLVVRGGASRQTGKTTGVPTDAAIVAIIDPYQDDLKFGK